MDKTITLIRSLSLNEFDRLCEFSIGKSKCLNFFRVVYLNPEIGYSDILELLGNKEKTFSTNFQQRILELLIEYKIEPSINPLVFLNNRISNLHKLLFSSAFFLFEREIKTLKIRCVKMEYTKGLIEVQRIEYISQISTGRFIKLRKNKNTITHANLIEENETLFFKFLFNKNYLFYGNGSTETKNINHFQKLHEEFPFSKLFLFYALATKLTSELSILSGHDKSTRQDISLINQLYNFSHVKWYYPELEFPIRIFELKYKVVHNETIKIESLKKIALKADLIMDIPIYENFYFQFIFIYVHSLLKVNKTIEAEIQLSKLNELNLRNIENTALFHFLKASVYLQKNDIRNASKEVEQLLQLNNSLKEKFNWLIVETYLYRIILGVLDDDLSLIDYNFRKVKHHLKIENSSISLTKFHVNISGTTEIFERINYLKDGIKNILKHKYLYLSDYHLLQ